MDRRCAAGALVALAACIATTAAAPTASNQTALDLYEGTSEGCYYNFQHYGEGDRIMTNEPCLNCTCHNRMLMCYLRVCPFTKPIGQDCSVEKRADQCCPIVTCPDVPVDLLTSTSTSSPSEYGETGLGKLDRYGCSINGKYFPEGAKVPPSPNKPCEHCYCIRNMTTCVMQECTLHVDGCTPIYRKDVCCPVRYSCDHPEDEIPLLDDMTTTVRPTPGFLLTTTTPSPVTQMSQDCVHDDKIFADGALIKTEKACEHCYCMKGDIVCVVQECGTPMENEGKNCTSMPPREGQCCPDTYICEGDELTTETKPDIATVTSFEDITTLSPPRRVSVEGSGYRNENDEPSTDVPIFEPDSEGSGDDQPSFKPTEISDMLIPESETSPPFIATAHDDIENKNSPSTTELPESDKEMAEKATTEAEKGVTIAQDDTDKYSPRTTEVPEYVKEMAEKATTEAAKRVTTAQDDTDEYSPSTTEVPEYVKEMAEKATTEADKKVATAQDDTDKYSQSTTEVPEYVKEMAEKATTEADKRVITAQDDTDKYSPSTTEVPEYVKEMAEKATTEADKKVTTAQDDTDKYSPSTTEVPEYVKEMAEKATTEADKKVTTAQDDTDKYSLSTTEVPEFIKEMAVKATTEADKKVTTAQDDTDKYSPTTTEVSESDKEMAENATTEGDKGVATAHDDIADKYSPTTTEVSESDKEMAEKMTTEADKGENTVPSGDIDEDTSEASVQDKTTLEPETTTSKLDAVTDAVDAKTTALPEGEISVKDKTTSQEITATEKVSIAESTIADYELHTSLGSRTTPGGEYAETTMPTRRKDNEINPTEITTLKHSEESSTKASDLFAPDAVVTKSTTSSFIEHDTETSTSKLPEKENDVTEPTTEVKLELTTKSDVIKSDTESATTVQPEIAAEISTLGKVDFTDTTSANPIENEIDEDSFSTLAPGRIPGEGDCLLDGVTYSHESIVPSSSNCHTSCRCISSIVKCEQIICSPPPDYMDNCQPMYDSSESCCPTYVCDHPKETVPPQSHSQMAGTESPIPTPTIECDGDQCEVVKDKEDAKPSVPCTSEICNDDSSKKHVDTSDCGPQGCGEVQTKPEEQRPMEPAEECAGDSCSSPPVDCASGNCETPIPKDQTCDNENGCEIPAVQTCQGDNCAIQPTKPEKQHPLEPAEECAGESCSSPPVNCASGNCEAPIPKDQTCDNENGCEIPAVQTCQGDNCAIQPDVPTTKNDSTPCDNPESCKDVHIPDKASECKGESCISESPTQTIPQEKQDCKDDGNCAQQTPAAEECNEENCKRQQIPEINKPSPSDCTGTECKQQDIAPKTTELPEINTDSAPKVTGLHEEPETKPEEAVTNLPQTTDIKTETEPSATTKVSISDKETEDTQEELGTTPQYDESDSNKETEPKPIVPDSPEKETSEEQQQESITESAVDKETTMVKEIIAEVTPAISEAPTTEISKLPDVDTKTPESITSIDNAHTEMSVTEEAAKDKDALDIITTEPSLPAVHSTSTDIHQETIESQEMLTTASDSFDRDGHEETTKEPEYVQDTEPKVTEPTERYTSAPDQITEKLNIEPTEGQEPQGAPTTPKSYEIQTNVPGDLETDVPMMEVLHSSTFVPETLTSTQEEELELPVPTSGKPDKTMDTADDVSSTDTKAETKSPVNVDKPTAKPEMVLDESETQSPELNVTPGEESITRAPIDETEIQTESSKPFVTLPQESATEESGTKEKDIDTPAPITVSVQTESPMSIVKDHGDDEISSTITPESGITTARDEIITKEPESPEAQQSTESIAKPTETPSEKPVEIEKMPSDVEYVGATTEQSGADLGTTISEFMETILPTKQPVHDSDITATPEAEASTDSAPVSVPIIIETISSEPSVTETGIQESSAPPEETSESAPITSIPDEDIETKSPVSVTESSGQLITEGVEIITQDLSNENTDATELPELVIHEHPTEPSSIVKESDQPATEDTATILPDTAVKEQDITPEKDTSDVPSPQDDVTVAPEIPKNELEVTVISEQESVTKMPDLSQSETTESKPVDASQILDLSPTESQKEVTEGPDSQTITSNAPETVVTDAQKEATEAPAIQTTVTSGTKISETEPQETVTEGVDVQYTVTDADLLVTQPHKHTTDTPVSYDMITNTPDMDTESHKESMNKTEESEMESHKQTTGIHDITTTIPEMSSTESHKPQKPTEAPYSHDAVTKVSDVSPTESDKAGVEEPQNMVTSVPKISATEPQEQTTSVPEAHDAATNIPETEPKMDVTETSVAQELTTSIPAVPVTENVPLEDTVSPMVQEKATPVPEIYVTEPQKEGTETPTHDDAFTNAPAEHTTESQKEVTDGPAAQDAVTNVPDTSITESDKYTQSLEPEVAETSATKLPETEPKKETTESPVQEASSAIPEISEIEPKKEVTEIPEIQVITDASEILHDSKAPVTTSTESQAGVTNVPEGQDATTNAPEIQTESQKEATEIQETPEKTITEAHNVPTEPPESQSSVADLSEVLTTESQKEATEIPDISMTTASIAPERIATKSDKDVTEAPEQVTREVTKTPELEATEAIGNEAEKEKPAVTEKDELFTETPLKMTTKFDDHTQSTPQEFVTSTKSSNIESVTSLPTESGLPIEQFTKDTESLVTESPDKTSGSDSDLDKPSTGMAADEKKPQEGQEIDTETPFMEPTKTVSPISPESIEPDTKAPELMDSETSTIAPELTVTEKQDHTQAPENEPQGSRRTEATSTPVKEEEVVTKAPQTLEPQDKTTKVSEEPEQTSDSKTEYSETTPYLVLLEEHTHKTVSPDEDVTVSPSDVPLNEYEPSTPEVTIDKVTDPVPSTEPEKSPEDVISDKDQSMPELTQTTIAEKSTESSLVSEEITTISPSPESLGTKKPQYDESNEISTSAPMTDQEQSETEKPSVPSVEAETEKEVDVTSQKPPETTAPEEEFIYATTKATTLKEEPTTLSPLLDKFGTSDDKPKPAAESEKPKPDTAEEVPKPGANEVQPTEEALHHEEETHFPPSGTSGYGQEPDYGEEDSFGPGTCRYGGKVYVSAQQIPRDDPCDFCFCFRSDIICLQQSCPPPIHGCHEEPIQGFCCPRYECPVSMATTLNVTTTTTTTTTTLPPHFLPHAYKGAAQRRGCQIKGHTYRVGEVVRASSGPCLHCTCGGDGQMKCDPKVCTPEPMLRQMIAAAVSSKRRR